MAERSHLRRGQSCPSTATGLGARSRLLLHGAGLGGHGPFLPHRGTAGRWSSARSGTSGIVNAGLRDIVSETGARKVFQNAFTPPPPPPTPHTRH